MAEGLDCCIAILLERESGLRRLTWHLSQWLCVREQMITDSWKPWWHDASDDNFKHFDLIVLILYRFQIEKFLTCQNNVLRGPPLELATSMEYYSFNPISSLVALWCLQGFQSSLFDRTDHFRIELYLMSDFWERLFWKQMNPLTTFRTFEIITCLYNLFLNNHLHSQLEAITINANRNGCFQSANENPTLPFISPE